MAYLTTAKILLAMPPQGFARFAHDDDLCFQIKLHTF
jgi:hypothetical protein